MTNDYELPPHLAERTLVLNDASPRAAGEFVLYWAHHALRAHENPALEAAAAIALRLELPLLVYQGLGGRHRYNSDRHHRFILEAARDFRAELVEHGLRLHFHLPREPVGQGPLAALLGRSAVAVGELFPVPPFTAWCRAHASANPDLPWLQVDASCNLPMPTSEERLTRAFQFRRRYMPELQQRIARSWPVPRAWPEAFDGDPGFETFDLRQPLGEAIADCQIDHSIPPVSDTVGGSVAGYGRWQEFLANGLGDYHRLRNDAAQPQAVSRLSPYLHYGCVSPMRIAREAAAHDGEGADKFLDELLTWRELNHHFCYHSPDLESLDILPQWARDSLAEHEADPRPALYDWETLLRGRSDEPLWNLAQRALLRRGELHNNLRMTWGKAILPWTTHANRTLRLLIDLNHRLALDGNDPNSYGGLLWCLGQFDRAFPPGAVFGKVRQRSARAHARRLDVDRYARLVSRPAMGQRVRVGIVGAGMAGLTAARILEDQGHEVIVVEKARGPGGRMSTRRQDALRFDHGAQYFTARDPRFLRHVLAWWERGRVEPWDARIAVLENGRTAAHAPNERRFVAVPGMNAICAEIAGELADCRFGWELARAEHSNGRWHLESTTGERLETEWLLMTAPPPQADRLLGLEPVRKAVAGVEMRPCWALMLVLDRPLLGEYDAAFVNEGPLSWLASQSSRPGRPDGHCWVAHANPAWSARHLEAPPETVQGALLEALRELPGAAPFNVLDCVPHRWRFALAEQPMDSGALWFKDLHLALAGDWCHGSRVEGAFLSGSAAAGRIMGSTLR